MPIEFFRREFILALNSCQNHLGRPGQGPDERGGTVANQCGQQIQMQMKIQIQIQMQIQIQGTVRQGKSKCG